MLVRRAAIVTALWLVTGALAADEGMWTLDDPPVKALRERYGFTPSPGWLEKQRLAAVRFNDGGSGSFVSSDGLMITNHHVGLGCIQNLSSPGHDYVAEGFYARARESEAACPGYEVNVLVKVEDITRRVLGAVRPAMSDKEAADARKAATASVENECNTRTGFRCDIVKLYQGGQYDLYQYRKYTDVRLVFAPEQGIAFFGGDPDNFTFPRHDLDISIFRAYENGRPVRPASFLRWSTAGANDGELVFVFGHPGSTARLYTMAQLQSLRDFGVPAILKWLEGRLGSLRAYGARGSEETRQAQDLSLRAENSQKAYVGRLAALQDDKAMARRAGEEKELRAKVAADAVLAAKTGDPWATIASARAKADPRVNEYRFVGFEGSRLLTMAGQIVRLVAEVKKPNEVRLEEYIDSSLPSLKNRLYSKAPIYDDLEAATLGGQLQMAESVLGREHPFVQAVLHGEPATEVAKALVRGTRLKDVDFRKALVEAGPGGVEASADPMIAIARKIDPLARAVRQFTEDEVQAPITRAAEKIAEARWKVYGKTVAPDATFTLRLAYGTVRGYPAEGTEVAPRTTLYGLFDRSASRGGQAPWSLPARWVAKKASLDLATPFNFISTNDIIGGNSGSPVVNRAGEFVGIIFDGNIQSLAWDYFYTDDQGRAVAVDARGILEALRKVFEADALVQELVGS